MRSFVHEPMIMGNHELGDLNAIIFDLSYWDSFSPRKRVICPVGKGWLLAFWDQSVGKSADSLFISMIPLTVPGDPYSKSCLFYSLK